MVAPVMIAHELAHHVHDKILPGPQYDFRTRYILDVKSR